jgi:MFS family permease
MNRYRTFIATPRVARMLSSALLARLPLGMTALAIVLVIREQGGSFALAGLASGLFTFANAACSPLQGRLIASYGPARVVSVSVVAHSIGLAGLATEAHVGASAPVIVSIALVAGPFVPPISACSRGLWPILARDPAALETAYALDAVSQELLWTSGPLIVATAASISSAILAVWLAALFTLVGGLWFATAPTLRAQRPTRSRAHPGVKVLDGFGLVAVLVAMALAGVGNGALALGLPALASHLGVRTASGPLLAMLSLGSLAGGLVHGGRAWSTPARSRYRALLGLSGVLALPVAVAPNVPVALLLSGVAGVPWAAMMSCQFALVNTVAHTGTATEAFAWNTSALVIGIAGGTAVAGVLVDAIGASGPFLLNCAACLAACGVTWTGGIHGLDVAH